jgi:hypothetical protein
MNAKLKFIERSRFKHRVILKILVRFVREELEVC